MRVLSLLLLVAMLPIVASAAPTPPGYTGLDRAQQAKLRLFLGTWQCVDVPASAKPIDQTTTQEGNFFVTRETGEAPNTQYMRWSHSYQVYYSVKIGENGSTNVTHTTSRDPAHSTWTTDFPARDPKGRAFFPAVITATANAFKVTSQFYDDKGHVRRFFSSCTKTG